MSIKHSFTSAKSDGADATLVKPSNWNADHTMTLPIVYQSVGSTALNTQNPAITIGAATTGHRLIVGLNLVGRGATSITCTNVTFTKVSGFTSSPNASRYEIWVGVVAGGSSGTTLTVNTASSNFSTIVMMEVADALTPTAGNTYNADVIGTYGFFGPLSTATSGNFIAAIVGCDNTTAAVMGWLGIPHTPYFKQASGTGLALMLGYAVSGSIMGLFTGASATTCYAIIQEIT
jgi:hypothetical protein